MKKRNKLTINISQWKNGSLSISDIECNSIDEAKIFIRGLKGKMKVKVYDENRRVQHSENVDNEDRHERDKHNKHHGHQGHHGHHHDDHDSYH